MADRDLRTLERRAAGGDRRDIDLLLWARARAGLVPEPGLLAVALERGRAPLSCWVVVGRVTGAELLAEVPFERAEALDPAGDAGEPGAVYHFRAPIGLLTGHTMDAATFYRGSNVLRRKEFQPMLVTNAIEVAMVYRVGDSIEDPPEE